MVRSSSIILDNKKSDFNIKEINYLGDFVEIILINEDMKILVKTSSDVLSRDCFKTNNKVGIKIKEEDICFFKNL